MVIPPVAAGSLFHTGGAMVEKSAVTKYGPGSEHVGSGYWWRTGWCKQNACGGESKIPTKLSFGEENGSMHV